MREAWFELNLFCEYAAQYSKRPFIVKNYVKQE
jgi:hypothetical protein